MLVEVVVKCQMERRRENGSEVVPSRLLWCHDPVLDLVAASCEEREGDDYDGSDDDYDGVPGCHCEHLLSLSEPRFWKRRGL